jgi:hypothetical protein
MEMTARNEILEAILALVCREHKISVADAKSKNRLASIVAVRQAYIYLARLHGENFTTPEIAKVINRDHSGVVYSTKKVKDLMKVDANYANKITSLIKLFSSEISELKVRVITNVVRTDKSEVLIKKVERLTTDLEALNVAYEAKSALVKDQMHQLNALHAQVLVLQSENKMLKDLQNNK